MITAVQIQGKVILCKDSVYFSLTPAQELEVLAILQQRQADKQAKENGTEDQNTGREVR